MKRSPCDVVEMTALAAHGLGDQRAGGLLGRDHAGRVELHQLHVHHPSTGVSASAIASPKFSSRREELRRQIRV